MWGVRNATRTMVPHFLDQPAIAAAPLEPMQVRGIPLRPPTAGIASRGMLHYDGECA